MTGNAHEPRTPEDWGDAFADLEPTYTAFVEGLASLLESLLDNQGYPYTRLRSWTVNVDSFVDRIYRCSREGKPPDNPASEWGDVAGVTIVTPTKAHVEPICELVEHEFEVDYNVSLTCAAAEAANAASATSDDRGRMFYDFPRFVVTLSHTRRDLAEWRYFSDVRAQVEVQTILQSAWEEIDGQLAYFWDSSYSEDARAAISRTLSLVASADDALLTVDSATDDAEIRYSHSLDLGELDFELDAAALRVYLGQSEIVSGLVAEAEHTGMRHDADPPVVSEAILWLLRTSGIRTVRGLDDFLREAQPRASAILQRVTELTVGDDDTVPWASPDSVVAWLVLVLTRSDVDTVALMRYRQSIEKALNTSIGNPVGG